MLVLTIKIPFEEIEAHSEGQTEEQVKDFLLENATDMVISYLINMADNGEFPPYEGSEEDPLDVEGDDE